MKQIVIDNFDDRAFSRYHYNRFGEYLKKRHGGKIAKVSVDAGFTCPNRDGSKGTGGCIFCDGDGGHTYVDSMRPDIGEQLERGKRLVGNKYKTNRFMVYFQSFTNTYAPFDRLVEIYSAILADSEIVGIAIATRADCIDDRLLAWLDQRGTEKEIWIELGTQSVHQKTLDAINRCERVDESRETIRRIVAKENILLCCHLIIGLPGETREMVIESVEAVCDLGIDAIKLHQLQIMSGLAAERIYLDGAIRPVALDDYIPLVADILEILPREMIVERISAYVSGRPKLLAPRWSVMKQEPANMLIREFERRKSFQGSAYR